MQNTNFSGAVVPKNAEDYYCSGRLDHCSGLVTDLAGVRLWRKVPVFLATRRGQSFFFDEI